MRRPTSTGNWVPLILHPLDRVGPAEVADPDRPWHTWFREHGTRLVKEYMDGFSTALKRELDERDLCYPRVMWWDMEDWALSTQAVRPTASGPALGTFTGQINDGRYDTEEILPGETLEDIYGTFTGSYYDQYDVTSMQNQPFLTWYLGWSVVIVQQAMLEAMMDKAADLFDLTVWSNYDRFSADNTDFRFPGNTWRMAYNTPPSSQATVQGDFSSPKLYTQNNLRSMVIAGDRLMPELGD